MDKEKDCLEYLKDSNEYYYYLVKDCGLEYEVEVSFQYYKGQGKSENDAAIIALAEWDLL